MTPNRTQKDETISVTCNMCGWSGHEDDLEIFKGGREFFKGCPRCETDSYLADVPF